MDQHEYTAFFEPQLEQAGYAGFLAGRPGKPDGCAVFFNRTYWEV